MKFHLFRAITWRRGEGRRFSYPSLWHRHTQGSSGLGRLAAKVMAAAAGGRHSAAVGEDGALFVWGCGHFGKLGTGDYERLAPTRVAGLPAPVRQVAAGSSI
ncbi:MAG: hypothetical protein ACPIOQ_34920 [Promethearchaeia archaeon]